MLCFCKTSSIAFGMSASIAIAQCPHGTGDPFWGAACIVEVKTCGYCDLALGRAPIATCYSLCGRSYRAGATFTPYCIVITKRTAREFGNNLLTLLKLLTLIPAGKQHSKIRSVMP